MGLRELELRKSVCIRGQNVREFVWAFSSPFMIIKLLLIKMKISNDLFIQLEKLIFTVSFG